MLRADLTSAARNKLASMRDTDQELVISTIRSLCLTDGREPKARGYPPLPEEEIILLCPQTARRVARILFRVEKRDAILRIVKIAD
jgi:hypothetical protein